MIRTGGKIDQISGDDMLHYADVVNTPGASAASIWPGSCWCGSVHSPARHRRCLRPGRRRATAVSTPQGLSSTATASRHPVFATYWSTISISCGPVWTTALEGLAYRLARLFWWEILDINPTQKDLRLTPAVTTAWRERLAMTTDGVPRREIHSILFTIRGLP